MTREESQKEWTARIAEFKASGQSQTAWCKTKNINRRIFTYWLAKFKNRKRFPILGQGGEFLTLTLLK